MDAKREAEIRARHEADVRLYAKYSVPHEHMDPCHKDRATLLAALDEARAQLATAAEAHARNVVELHRADERIGEMRAQLRVLARAIPGSNPLGPPLSRDQQIGALALARSILCQTDNAANVEGT